MSGATRNFVGFYVGTGAAQTLSEFGPVRHVVTTSLADGSKVENWLGNTSAASAGGMSWDASDADGLGAPLVAAAGITFVDGGFQVGTSDLCNESGVVYAYVASN